MAVGEGICEHSQYQAEVIDLILKIQQQEFGVLITLKNQPDLSNIPKFYQQGNGNFWIALNGDNIIGTIAAIDVELVLYLKLKTRRSK